jgi:hypothetical protein
MRESSTAATNGGPQVPVSDQEGLCQHLGGISTAEPPLLAHLQQQEGLWQLALGPRLEQHQGVKVGLRQHVRPPLLLFSRVVTLQCGGHHPPGQLVHPGQLGQCDP